MMDKKTFYNATATLSNVLAILWSQKEYAHLYSWLWGHDKVTVTLSPQSRGTFPPAYFNEKNIFINSTVLRGRVCNKKRVCNE